MQELLLKAMLLLLRGCCCLQEVAAGKSLAEVIASGMRADETEVLRIATDLLDILKYLGSLRPPVIHRDIKPENVILEGGRWGGRVYLVDFGGVQGVTGAGVWGVGCRWGPQGLRVGSSMEGTMRVRREEGGDSSETSKQGNGRTELWTEGGLCGGPWKGAPVHSSSVVTGSVTYPPACS